jgi:hypothetical protein
MVREVIVLRDLSVLRDLIVEVISFAGMVLAGFGPGEVIQEQAVYFARDHGAFRVPLSE